MANRNRSRRAGFSLLELIIVLMVMISLMAIAWPNLQRPLRRQPLGEAAEVLRTAIDESRYKAITEGHPQFVLLRQGSSDIQSASFESFLSQSDTMDSKDLPLSNSAALDINRTPMNLSASVPPVRHWLLPDSVKILEVRWSLEPPADEEDEQSLTETPIRAEVDTEFARDPTTSDLSSELNQANASEARAWWLPLVATGHGRDAAIVLIDTAINEEVTVTFEASTGALEVVR